MEGKSGGTWLAISTDGSFGALTNYRQAPSLYDPTRKGRGNLVVDFLRQGGDVGDYLQNLKAEGDHYHGFNLLLGKISPKGKSQAGWYCNTEDKTVKMLSAPGTYVLSNRLLDFPWPKVVYGRQRFTEIIQNPGTKEDLINNLIGLLKKRER